jgi:uncharacterized protein YebE (UPF0316 family)
MYTYEYAINIYYVFGAYYNFRIILSLRLRNRLLHVSSVFENFLQFVNLNLLLSVCTKFHSLFFGHLLVKFLVDYY